MDRRLEDLVEMIPTGKDDAISRRDLMKQLKVSDRKLREMIHEAREVYPILSNTGKGGYYLPANKEEAEAYIRQSYSYISEIHKTIPPVKRYMEAKGQRRMTFERTGHGTDHHRERKDDSRVGDSGSVSQVAFESIFSTVL